MSTVTGTVLPTGRHYYALSERISVSVDLVHVGDRTTAEIAAAVGRAPSTVYRWKRAARAQIAQLHALVDREMPGAADTVKLRLRVRGEPKPAWMEHDPLADQRSYPWMAPPGRGITYTAHPAEPDGPAAAPADIFDTTARADAERHGVSVRTAQRWRRAEREAWAAAVVAADAEVERHAQMSYEDRARSVGVPDEIIARFSGIERPSGPECHQQAICPHGERCWRLGATMAPERTRAPQSAPTNSREATP